MFFNLLKLFAILYNIIYLKL